MSEILNAIIKIFKMGINLLFIFPIKLIYRLLIHLPFTLIKGLIEAVWNLFIKVPSNLIGGFLGGLGG